MMFVIKYTTLGLYLQFMSLRGVCRVFFTGFPLVNKFIFLKGNLYKDTYEIQNTGTTNNHCIIYIWMQ